MFRKFKADRIFNGDNFAPPHSVLITTAAGEIIDFEYPANRVTSTYTDGRKNISEFKDGNHI